MKFRRILAVAIAAVCVGGGVSVTLASSATATTSVEPCYQQVQTQKHRWKRDFGGQKQVKGWEYSQGAWRDRNNSEWYTIPAHLNPPFYLNVARTGRVNLNNYQGPNVVVDYQYPTPGTEWYPSPTGYATDAEFLANATGGGWTKVDSTWVSENGNRIPCTDKPADGKETTSTDGVCQGPGAMTVTVTNEERTFTWTYNYSTETWEKTYGPWTVTGTNERPLTVDEQASPACKPAPDPDQETWQWAVCSIGDTVATGIKTTTTYTPVYAAGPPASWTQVGSSVDEPVTRPLDEQEQQECRPSRDPSQEREDAGEPQCGDTSIVVRVVTTSYSYTFVNGAWEEHTSQATTFETRELAESELVECGSETPTVTPVAPAHNPPSCTAPGSVELPQDIRYSWRDNGDGTYTAVAADGVVLVGQTTFGPFAIAQLTGTSCDEASIDLVAFSPECQADIPYIDYRIEVSGTDADTATLTFIDTDGVEIETHTGVPLKGQVIYPGASEEPDWPGWRLNEAGLWVVDPIDDHWRDGLTVRVEVNPTAFSSVVYPEPTDACYGPPVVQSGAPTTTANPTTTTTSVVTTSTATLPPTGSTTTPLVVAAVGMLTAGLGLIALTRRGREA